jgi:hypothetical protein
MKRMFVNMLVASWHLVHCWAVILAAQTLPVIYDQYEDVIDHYLRIAADEVHKHYKTIMRQSWARFPRPQIWARRRWCNQVEFCTAILGFWVLIQGTLPVETQFLFLQAFLDVLSIFKRIIFPFSSWWYAAKISDTITENWEYFAPVETHLFVPKCM